MKATLRGTLGWRHAFDEVTPFSTFAFTGGSAFNIAGVPIARDAAVVDAGLEFAIAKGATVGISYNGQFGNEAADQSVRGNFTIKF
jgi:subtilase-type serine protease